MFAFITFFKGREFSAVENIDHDRVVELMFETLPQVKEDDRFSFAVTRYVPVILMLLMLVGCATTSRPEMVDGKTLEQQLDAYIDDYYNQVAGLCTELHGKAVARQSKVDCAISGTQMHVSFPSKAYHDNPRRLDDIAQLYQHWCAASGSKFGKPGTWVRYFRKEKVTQSMTCRSNQVPNWTQDE